MFGAQFSPPNLRMVIFGLCFLVSYRMLLDWYVIWYCVWFFTMFLRRSVFLVRFGGWGAILAATHMRDNSDSKMAGFGARWALAGQTRSYA